MEAIFHVNDHVLKIGYLTKRSRALGSTYGNGRRWIVRLRHEPEELTEP